MATRLISLTDAYAHPALGFEEPATPIDAGRWRLAVADEHGRLRTRGYWGRERSTIVAQHLGAADVYASRCAFAPKGGFDAQSVWFINGAWVDLDIYTVPTLRHLSPDDAVARALATCDAADVPRPSYTVFSGRGLYLHWSYANPVPGCAKARCLALNRRLATVFAPLGADPRATDLARILRVVGSVNSKSDTLVRVIHREETAGGHVVRYSLDALAEAVLGSGQTKPSDRSQHGKRQDRAGAKTKSRQRARSAGHGRGGPACYHTKALADIKTLVRLRWPDGQIPEGWRDTIAFHLAVEMAHLMPADEVLPAVQEWAWSHLPARFIHDKLPGYLSTLLRRAHADAADRATTKTSDGPAQAASQVYSYSKATLIARLGITPAESVHMQTLIVASEQRTRERERGRQRRRAQGRRSSQTHAAERRARADARAARIIVLRDQAGLSWAAIAEQLGEDLTPDAVRKLYKRAMQRRAGPDTAAGGEAAA